MSTPAGETAVCVDGNKQQCVWRAGTVTTPKFPKWFSLCRWINQTEGDALFKTCPSISCQLESQKELRLIQLYHERKGNGLELSTWEQSQ